MIYDLFNKLRGSAWLTVTGPDPAALLSRCAEIGLPLLSARSLDAVTLRVRVPSRELARFRALAERCQFTVERQRVTGAGAAGRKLYRRLGAAVPLLLLLGVLLWSKLYLWEIEVRGNETVPTGEILSALSDCGVHIGSFWPNFTSDSIRSQVLVRLPSLSWITVNVYGSRAEVIVRERIKKPEMLRQGEPADIVAGRDGFIMAVRALAGKEQVRRGQAVRTGQLLVSGTVPDRLGGSRTVHAYGSVIARTYYEMSALVPLARQEKRYTGEEKTRWALRVGEKTINFYKNSSIYDRECDKIYTAYKLEIKGLFSLPVTLLRQSSRFYETQDVPVDESERALEAEQTLHERLLSGLAAGEILSEAYSVSAGDGVLTVCLRSECEEDIGVTVPRG